MNKLISLSLSFSHDFSQKLGLSCCMIKLYMGFRCQASDICFFLMHQENIYLPESWKVLEDLISWWNVHRCFSDFFFKKTIFSSLRCEHQIISQLVLEGIWLSGDFSTLLCSNCLLTSGVMRLVIQGCCRRQNTKCSTQACNRIIFAQRLLANFKLKKQTKSQVDHWILYFFFLFSTGSSSVIDSRSGCFSNH